MKVRPMKGLVGNMILIIAKTVVIASLKLFYGDLTRSLMLASGDIESRIWLNLPLLCLFNVGILLTCNYVNIFNCNLYGKKKKIIHNLISYTIKFIQNINKK